MGLIEALGSGPVALDTPIFIYFIEQHERYLPVIAPLFEALDGGSLEGVTSGLTLMETLVHPYRLLDRSLAGRYESLMTGSRGLRLIELSPPVLRSAARIRAELDVKAPDAMQLAAALHGGCSALLTNDRRLPDLPSLEVLQLEDFAAPEFPYPEEPPAVEPGPDLD